MSQERISFADLTARIEGALLDAGASAEVASVIARNCAGCERDGALSHGIFRVPGYASSLRVGHVDGGAAARISRETPSLIRIDAANGFAQSALDSAEDEIEAALADTGVAVVALRDSHHFSALWPDVEPFAEAGLFALTMVTGGAPTVMPRGVNTPVFGTNPIAFASPVAGADPLVLDFATSTVSHGDLQLARIDGRSVPIGTGVGSDGRDTEDPAEILDEGGILPFGGHKGAGLSLMVELLASALTGGAFSFEADERSVPGAETSRTGQLLIVIDPARGGNEVFPARVAAMIDMLHGAGMSRLPGDARYRRRAEAAEHGIPVTQAIRDLLG